MKPDAKLDLDALLGRWPAPHRDDAAWSDRADAIVRAALDARDRGGDTTALLGAPPLAREPGEPHAHEGSVSSFEAPRKKESLKDLALRASQSGRGSAPPSRPSGIPAPISTASAPPSRARAPSPVPPAPARSEDSGLIDLKSVEAGARSEIAGASVSPKPNALSFVGAASKPPASIAANESSPTARANRNGMMAGIAIAVLGLAAAAIIVLRAHPNAPSPILEAKAVETSAPSGATPPAPAPPQPSAVAVDSAGSPGTTEAAPKNVGTPPNNVGAGGPSSPGKVESNKVAAPDPKSTVAPTPSSAPAAAPDQPSDPSDLAGAMAKATGSDKTKPGASEAPEPAAGGVKNSAVPEQPPQGSVTSAVGSVMGAAKGCVVGADDVSRAQITFASSGAVSNVSVTGWAARKGATSCVKAALKGANVGPFSKPSFTVGVTIRP